ncbi:MAG: hypothetical protein R3E96_03390 [Planctomycetota bacterium]
MNCWFTGQAATGAGVGTNDVDGAPTLMSPVFSLSANPVSSATGAGT